MIKIECVETYGWEAAIRGMRNPMNSWDKSDTAFWCYPEEGVKHKIGENDLKLMQTLSKAGSDHGKFLRMITVTLDITAPLYWWKELDTYKVGTVANSCSTMHTIHKTGIDESLFSFDCEYQVNEYQFEVVDRYLHMLEDLRQECKSGDGAWRALIQFLPCGFNQKRTVQLNYQVLKAMYHARKAHKLDEWRFFCSWIETLPYAKELIIGEE